MRPVSARYIDPLSAIWLGCAAALGLRVERHPGAYASTDGHGRLLVAPPEDLDPDDCLAQIILHELCHALVQGEDSFTLPDWGLRNDETSLDYAGDTVREQACLRVQAALTRRYGLRRLLAPTTDFRSFYDALPADPLDAPAGDPALPLSRAALGRAASPPFAGPLHQALAATAAIHQLLPGPGREGAVGGDPPSLWDVAPAPRRHPIGVPLREAALGPATCGTCAWRFSAGASSRCRRSPDAAVEGQERKTRPVDPAWPACVLYEATLDCQTCGACCRHAYDLVPLSRRDPAARRHPELVQEDADGARLRRDPRWNRCAALTSADGADGGPYGCSIYAERPRTCRDFPVGGTSCLWARRRVGLSA